MKPIQTAETTDELQPHPADVGTVSPLPVYREDGAIVSIWEPDEDEYRDVGAVHGRFGVKLSVLGDCPPVRLEIVTLHDTPMMLERSVLVDGKLKLDS